MIGTDFTSVKAMLAWIEKSMHIKKESNWKEPILNCCQARSGYLPDIKRLVKKPLDCFDETCPLYRRLGAHRHAVLIVVQAWLRVPSLKDIVRIWRIPPAEERKTKLLKEILVL